MLNLVDQVKNAGVVGAGGAGFPTHIKLGAQLEWYLANGAECEPLIHKDRELMIHFASEVISGLDLAAASVSATHRVIGLKSKNKAAIQALTRVVQNKSIRIQEFGDYYPAGDEYELVYGITGRLIPPQGIPLNIGVLVNNVETLYNIYRASQGKPVTDTFLTIAGLVKNPITTRVPIGMLMQDVLALAGGPIIKRFTIMESGLLMGKRVTDVNQPVTKTTSGLIVMPSDHPVIQRYNISPKAMDRIGHSACDQCCYCTELCPRYLLGYDVQPHLVMRSLGFSLMGSELWNRFALLCCQCGVCTLYACPEALFPREACIRAISDLRAHGQGGWTGSGEIKAHPMKDARRIPLKQLQNRLGVSQFDAPASFIESDARPAQVRILLRQHIGQPSQPIIRVGDRVRKGERIAKIPEASLGANLHASIEGKVTWVDDQMIIITRES